MLGATYCDWHATLRDHISDKEVYRDKLNESDHNCHDTKDDYIAVYSITTIIQIRLAKNLQ